MAADAYDGVTKSQPKVPLAVITGTESNDGHVLALIHLCGLPLLKRTLFALRAVGVWEVIVLAGQYINLIREEIGDTHDLGLHVRLISEQEELLSSLQHQQRFLALEGNYVWDERILRALCETDHLAVAIDSEARLEDQIIKMKTDEGRLQPFGNSDSTGAYIGAAVCERDVLLSLTTGQWWEGLVQIARERPVYTVDIARLKPYHSDVRRIVKPYWFRIRSDADTRRAKMELIESAQKGALDWWAWYINRPIENWLLRRIADWPITPNQMSLLVNMAAYAVALLWATKHLWPWALLAVIVSVLDGLDGKLARVKGLASKLGTIEHSFDVLWEQVWYIALAWVAYTMSGDAQALLIGFALLLLDTFNRHISIQFRQTTGRSLAEYSVFDRSFRWIDGRRNTYLPYILVGAALGIPLLSLSMMTVHAGLTAIVYATRVSRHFHALDIGQEK